MDREDMDRVTAAFEAAVRRASSAGFDIVELHMAHGYLLSSFLSPLANKRTDEYGGKLENRLRYPLEVFRAVRAAWPDEKPLAVRLTATDWMTDGSGFTVDEAVEVATALREAGCDLIDVSGGGNAPESRPEWGRMVHVPFAERIRYEARIPVAVVGAIQGADHANTVLAAGRADLAVMARAHLADPYLTLHAAEEYGYFEAPWPQQYLAAKRQPPRPAPGKKDAR
jgi:anthraniloyl-CoA monooxygenase